MRFVLENACIRPCQIILFADRNRADGEHGIKTIHTLTFQTVIGITHGLLVEVFQNVLHDLGDTLLRFQRFLGINRINLFILIAVFQLDSVDIVDAERQDISIVDSIDGSQPRTEPFRYTKVLSQAVQS